MLHCAAFKDGTITLATITRAYDDDLFYYIIWSMIMGIMSIHDLATFAVSLRQSNNKLHETLGGDKYKLYDKSKWVHRISVLTEMFSIIWFIIKYNMIYQYLAYLARRWIQSKSTFKVINNEVINNTYIRKLKAEFKDGITITNFIIFSATVLVNSFITENTIMRTIGLYGIKMHHAIICYIDIISYIMKLTDKNSPLTTCTVSQICVKNNKMKEIVIELSPHDLICTKTQEMNSSFTTCETRYTVSNETVMQMKKADTIESQKSNSEIGDALCDITKQLSPFPLCQFSQIPPYICKHCVYIKHQTSIPSLQCGNSLPQYHYCNLEHCSITVPKNPQHFTYMPQSKDSLAASNVTSCSTNIDGRQYIYQMNSKPRGISIIINNENFRRSLKSRSGTSIDSHNLWNLFVHLGFDTQHHNNKTHIEMRHVLNNVATMDHDKYDCLMVTILTHGDYGDLLYGTTGEGILIQEVIETFSGRRCPTLIGKPKVFIIQACRGRRYNQTVQLDNDCNDMTDSGLTIHPNISDYLVAHSTIPGHVSFRNNTGSIFISTLVKIFRKHAAYEDIVTMLERVTNEVMKYEPQGDGLQDTRQSPEIRSTLRGRVYFNTSGKCKWD